MQKIDTGRRQLIRRRALFILLVLVMASSAFLSSTLAKFAVEYSGIDIALTAKWCFGARGEDDVEGMFYNKGFTFDLFSAKSVMPMDFGSKSFTFTGGGSDVAIVYNVEMNTADLLYLTSGTVAQTADADIYAPFIFKITVSINEDASDPAPAAFVPPVVYGSGWFRPSDITADGEGFFNILDLSGGTAYFSASSTDKITVTVYWQWNTSCYINGTGAAVAPPDTSTEISGTYLPYYQKAYDGYYGTGGLEEQANVACSAVAGYLNAHGSPSDDGTWSHDIACTLTDEEHNLEYAALAPEQQEDYLLEHNGRENGSGGIVWGAHGIPCPADHYAEYNVLVTAEENAVRACNTSLLAAYDDYDTLAANALDSKESVKVIFRISAQQIQPE